jgi:hypothetical protein
MSYIHEKCFGNLEKNGTKEGNVSGTWKKMKTGKMFRELG